MEVSIINHFTVKTFLKHPVMVLININIIQGYIFCFNPIQPKCGSSNTFSNVKQDFFTHHCSQIMLVS